MSQCLIRFSVRLSQTVDINVNDQSINIYVVNHTTVYRSYCLQGKVIYLWEHWWVHSFDDSSEPFNYILCRASIDSLALASWQACQAGKPLALHAGACKVYYIRKCCPLLSVLSYAWDFIHKAIPAYRLLTSRTLPTSDFPVFFSYDHDFYSHLAWFCPKQAEILALNRHVQIS